MEDLHKDWNGQVGEYTYEEFYETVKSYRDRWCRNTLAVYPRPDRLVFFGSKRVVYHDDKVVLEEIHDHSNDVPEG